MIVMWLKLEGSVFSTLYGVLSVNPDLSSAVCVCVKHVFHKYHIS